jgi:vacuolar-type H+-ATPase subunit I/STV1
MADFESHMDSLAERAKKANERAQATLGATKETLQAEVSTARASVEKTNRQLQAKATTSDPAKRWSAARETWNTHTAEIRGKADAEKAKHDASHAERRAERAEADALEAIDFAYLALEEAEYEVLDAALARAEADELAARV